MEELFIGKCVDVRVNSVLLCRVTVTMMSLSRAGEVPSAASRQVAGVGASILCVGSSVFLAIVCQCAERQKHGSGFLCRA